MNPSYSTAHGRHEYATPRGLWRAAAAGPASSLILAAASTGITLGLTALDAGRLPESLAVFADLVKEAEAGLPVGHRFTAVSRRNHGRVLARLARYPEAERELLRAQADLHGAVLSARGGVRADNDDG